MATLLGLDFGSTTSSAVIATAHFLRNAVTGRMELGELRETYRSPLAFTPLRDEQVDEEALQALLDGWLREGRVETSDIVGGGALLTGLTARRANAGAIVRLVRQRVGDALVAAADDPRLESWLAFLGSCATLSRRHPQAHFLNLDIGGGTTNAAWGREGRVLATASAFIGARHVRVQPGSYRITGLSEFGDTLLRELGISRRIGDTLRPDEVRAFIDCQVELLDDLVASRLQPQRPSQATTASIAAALLQSPWSPTTTQRPDGDVFVTLSGGVGELAYALASGGRPPARTAYGDLGIDLAAALVADPRWRTRLQAIQPDGGGRATVYGLLRHNTQLSGNTLHLTDAGLLPLRDLPIFGTIGPETQDAELGALLELLERSPAGGALCVELADASGVSVRRCGERLRQFLDARRFPDDLPLVLLVRHNVGKALGNYLTDWGRRPLRLLVVDEIDLRDARYVHLGVLREQTIPVSFFGLA